MVRDCDIGALLVMTAASPVQIAVSSDGSSALHIASLCQRVEIVKILVGPFQIKHSSACSKCLFQVLIPSACST